MGPKRRGRRPGRCKAWVKEYMNERVTGRGTGGRGGVDCLGREKQRLFCHTHSFQGELSEAARLQRL